jgi:hypothetical protein
MLSASGAELSKVIRKGWSKSSISALTISNKFGEVRINDAGGDSVAVKVVIKINDSSEKRARDLLNKIHISIEKSGGMIAAETEIEDGFKGNESLTIDYLVNIPKDRDLNISNKYGNVIVNELEAKGSFEISYGAITAGKMKAPAGNAIQMNIK